MDHSNPARISLGASGLSVSPVGMGTNAWGFNRLADPEKGPTLAAALQAGINFIDTAEVYHFGGSEKTLGLLLPKSGQDVVLATKFFPYPWRLSKSSLADALRASLERLGLPKVQLYILHFPVPPVPLETWLEALAEVQQSGLTRAVGISNCTAQQTRRAQAVLARHAIPLASNQVEYSLLNRSAERSGLLDTCRELGVSLVAYRPLGYGLLTGKYQPADLPKILHGRLISRLDLQKVAPLVELLGELAQRHTRTRAQVALNWIVCKGALPIPGAKNARQAAENAGAFGWRLDPVEVEALDRASQGWR